jgi:predicted TPR repeat methyltransferase
LLRQETQDYAGAIDCFVACLQHGGPDAGAFGNLGRLRYETGQFSGAREAYAEAARLDPSSAHFSRMAAKSRFISDVGNGSSVTAALEVYQTGLPAGDAFAEDELLELLESTFGQLSGFRQIAAARGVGAKYLELRPDSPTMIYLMKATAGSPDLDRAPPQYIVEHFDSFAAGFDAQLVNKLGYDIPKRICDLARQHAELGRFYDALDAGCGTGLCGPHLRPLARTLAGVDLSQKMLDEAAKKGIYDELVCEDLVAYLDRCPGRFDLVVAADVMIYLGDLRPVFAAAAKSIQPGGLLGFSIELWGGEGFHVLPTGRFAHAPAYVRFAAAPDFEEIGWTEATIRLEAARPVPGQLFVFRRAKG